MRAVHTLKDIDITENRVIFFGANGVISLTALRQGVYQLEYSLEKYLPSDELRKASELFYSHDSFDSSETSMELILTKEEADQYVFICGEDRLVMGRSDGLFTVYHGNRRVHGGLIGSEDTVLPRYPMRILGGLGEETRVRFNFRLEDKDRFYGLGDKAGGINKRGQRYHMYNRDALGYHAAFFDPLYKSIPFILKQIDNVSFSGLYFPVPKIGEIDLGRESSYFFSVEMFGGPFSYVVFTGDAPWDILERYTWLTGRPSLPPLYTFGFLGSSMNYTENDDADERISEYFDQIEEYRIPCEGFYFSSGYVKADNGERYTFRWNKKKFPNPASTLRKYQERGYHIACNIKPGFLINHPDYQMLDEKGYFIKDRDGNSYVEYYWGNNASFIDLSNPAALAWWKRQLKEQLLNYGVSGIWNDNNELEIEDQGLDAQRIRALFPVLMARASWEACQDVHPNKRPWIISRSGGPGLQKYARTWTGDNVSDWESLKFNQFMGFSLGLSGIPYYGHDIGGFFGDHPDTKQFIRWCQSAVFQPRFVIHSWNEDGRPTEIWSYPDSIEVIRDLVKLHYEFMPYIYNTAFEAAQTGIPMERPLVLMFPEDEKIDPNCVHYMFGEDILVLSAVEEDEEIVDCYLPQGTRWYDPHSGKYLEGGSIKSFNYPYHGIRYLIREGSFIVTSPGCQKLDTGFFANLNIFFSPKKGEIVSRSYIEDNGDDVVCTGSYNRYEIEIDYRFDTGNIRLRRTATVADGESPERNISFQLPNGYEFCGKEKGEIASLSKMPKVLSFQFKETRNKK